MDISPLLTYHQFASTVNFVFDSNKLIILINFYDL